MIFNTPCPLYNISTIFRDPAGNSATLLTLQVANKNVLENFKSTSELELT